LAVKGQEDNSLTIFTHCPGRGKVKPIPEDCHSAMPYWMVRDAARAIEFHKNVFGAPELLRLV
jgi:hypothetical protein